MKTSTLIIILIGIVLIVLTLQHKKQSDWTDYAQGGFEADDYIAGAEAIGTGALAKKNEEDEGDDDKTAGIIDMFLKPPAIIMIGILLMFMMGGGNFLFSNPILIFFAVIMFIVTRWKK